MQIEQVDREAALAYNKEQRTWAQIEVAQDRAAKDTVELAQAFARHRHAAMLEGARLMQKAAADFLASVSGCGASEDDMLGPEATEWACGMIRDLNLKTILAPPQCARCGCAADSDVHRMGC